MHIYRDRKKEPGATFGVFSLWLTNLLFYNKSNIYEFRYIMHNLEKYINYKEDIDVFFKKHFGIQLYDVHFYRY